MYVPTAAVAIDRIAKGATSCQRTCRRVLGDERGIGLLPERRRQKFRIEGRAKLRVDGKHGREGSATLARLAGRLEVFWERGPPAREDWNPNLPTVRLWGGLRMRRLLRNSRHRWDHREVPGNPRNEQVGQ